MGIKLPFTGYVLPSKFYDLKMGRQSAVEERRHADIQELFTLIYSLREGLSESRYPAGAKFELRGIFMEDNIDERPVLRRILNERKLGSIVVCYRDDLYVQGTGVKSTASERSHAKLIERMVARLVPVISVRQTKENPSTPLQNLIKMAESREGLSPYQVIAKNYADNRESLEDHYDAIRKKPRG